ncbi:MAG: NAD-binding protein [Campylobacterales bacterium]|nr:NAD-binding protein [Campylobacterales bacterium]
MNLRLLEKLKKLLHWETKEKPKITLSGEFYELLKPFRLPLILVQLSLMIGTIGYLLLTDYNITEALFQAAYTFTTTGFGALREDQFSGPAIVFTTTLMLLGFVVLTFSVGIIIDVINKGDLLRIMKERKMLYKIARLKNHYVVCYHNEYTVHLAEQLKESHIPFVIIHPEDTFDQIATKNRYPYYLVEEPHTEEALIKSHMSSAKGVITLSKNIADNIAMIASLRLYEKEVGRDPFYIIGYAENNSDIEKLKKLGADSVVSPAILMAKRVSAMAIRPDMENLLEEFLYKKDTALDLEEVLIPRNSWMVLKKIKETHLRESVNVSIIGIRQKDGKFIPMPRGDTHITSESKLLIIGTSKAINDAKRIIKRNTKPDDLKYV